MSDASAEDIVLALTAVGLNIDEARRCAAAIFRGRLRRPIAGIQGDQDWTEASLDAEQLAAVGEAAAALEFQRITLPPSILRAALTNLGIGRELRARAQSATGAATPPDKRAGRDLSVQEVESKGLAPLTSEQWFRARQALGKGRKWLLLGTSKKALDDALTQVQQAARGSVQQRNQPSAV